MATDSYKCPTKGCGRTFSSSARLGHHRNTCKKKNSSGIRLNPEYKSRKKDRRTGKVPRISEGSDVTGIDLQNPILAEPGQSSAVMLEDMPEQIMVVEDIPEPIAIPEPLQPAPNALKPSKTGRARFLPSRFIDNLPTLSRTMPNMIIPQKQPTPPPIPAAQPAPAPSPEPSPEPVKECPLIYVDTVPDTFGIYRSYPKIPKAIPDEEVPIADVCEGAGFPCPPPSDPLSVFGSTAKRLKNVFAPFLNATVFRLMSWFYNSCDSKSLGELDKLVNDVLLADDFDTSHLEGFSARKVVQDMDDYGGPTYLLSAEDGWIESSVKIPLPAEGIKQAEENAPMFEIKGIHYRKPLEVIKAVFQSPASRKFHYIPFRLFQKHASPGGSDSSTRLHSELYNSDAYLQEYERIQVQQQERQRSDPEFAKEPDVENVPVAIMAWSDETHVSQFGGASMWPIYLYFGNQSKYDRAKPSTFAAHHLAYIAKLSDDLQDYYKSQFGFPASQATLTHLKRELIQAIWALILDPEFMHAYEHGILVKCGDGIIRRLFPRFFTYSADYPEKVLLATIRSLGKCPCPHCLVEKDQIRQLGTHWDRRRRENKPRVDTEQRRSLIDSMRRWIFDFGYRIASQAIEAFLQPLSYIPTRNTFSERFAKFGFNFYNLFVPDVLHEIELGIWKAVLTHLIRILFAVGNDTVQELNQRYRKIPSFGRSTIRRIRNNVSAMKQLAARDFEDMLQASMPVFEGLVPEFDKEIMDLLFDLNTFHSFAKLRLHSELSLQILDESVTSLGKALRCFTDKVCSTFDTQELPKETAARGRRKAKLAEKRKGGDKEGTKKGKGKEASKSIRKSFNMCTYKIHAAGHYVCFIKLYGPTDNYSTQIGELEHRRVKRFYGRTNKVFKFTRQVTALEKRRRIIEGMKDHIAASQDQLPRVSFQHSDPIPVSDPDTRYSMSKDTSKYLKIDTWMDENDGDPALKNIHAKLKEHLYCRFTGSSEEQGTTLDERSLINIRYNRIYTHKVLRINYTTYDLRRSQDSINTRTNSDIMVLASDAKDGDHPYWYARVLGIFHAVVSYGNLLEVRVDFLWVRWFGLDSQYKFGWKEKRLPRVGFIDGHEPCAFGFVDPQAVIRAVHLVPSFNLGRTKAFLGPSIARKASENDEDWYRYYVNIFADRDMVVRYRPELGLGGHHKFTMKTTIPTKSISVNNPEEGIPDVAGKARTASAPPEVPPEDQNDEAEAEKEDEGELMDYGYEFKNGDSDEDEDHEELEGNPQAVEDEDDIGPEDGEEPVNHDLEVHEAEGYGLL